jgi:hypothetical protein
MCKCTEDIKNIIGACCPLMAPDVSFGPGCSPGVDTVAATGFDGFRKRGYSIMAAVSFDSRQKFRYANITMVRGLDACIGNVREPGDLMVKLKVPGLTGEK